MKIQPPTPATLDKRAHPYDTRLYSVVEIEMDFTGLEVLWTFRIGRYENSVSLTSSPDMSSRRTIPSCIFGRTEGEHHLKRQLTRAYRPPSRVCRACLLWTHLRPHSHPSHKESAQTEFCFFGPATTLSHMVGREGMRGVTSASS